MKIINCFSDPEFCNDNMTINCVSGKIYKIGNTLTLPNNKELIINERDDHLLMRQLSEIYDHSMNMEAEMQALAPIALSLKPKEKTITSSEVPISKTTKSDVPNKSSVTTKDSKTIESTKGVNSELAPDDISDAAKITEEINEE